jgi:hypothetical protein
MFHHPQNFDAMWPRGKSKASMQIYFCACLEDDERSSMPSRNLCPIRNKKKHWGKDREKDE